VLTRLAPQQGPRPPARVPQRLHPTLARRSFRRPAPAVQQQGLSQMVQRLIQRREARLSSDFADLRLPEVRRRQAPLQGRGRPVKVKQRAHAMESERVPVRLSASATQAPQPMQR